MRPTPASTIPIPSAETDRLAAVLRSGLIGAPPEAALDGLVRLAAKLCDTSSAEINLVGAEQLWFVAARGLGTPGQPVARELTFCTWTILDPDRPMIVLDAKADARFAQNPFVVDGTIGTYAGVPLIFDGQAIGTMCVHDPAPNRMDADKLDTLRVLATAAQSQIALRRHVDELSTLARTDALTGTANRRAMDEALERELHRVTRSGGPLAVAMLDMDRFKAYNDAFGHPSGDLLLQRAATAWRGELRACDVLARWGEEEFCVLLADCEADGALGSADRLRSVVPGGQTCSIGVAAWDGQEDVAGLVARADAALYEAKHAGRDCIVLAGVQPRHRLS